MTLFVIAGIGILTVVLVAIGSLVVRLLLHRRRQAVSAPSTASTPRRGTSTSVLLVLAGIVILVLGAPFAIYIARGVALRDEVRRAAEETRLRHVRQVAEELERGLAEEGTVAIPDRRSRAAGGDERVPPSRHSASPHVFLAFDVRDDHADWLRDNELQEHPPPRPSWVETNAGAERWIATDAGIAIKSHRPGDSERIAGYSRYAGSAEQARGEAIDRATEKLTALVLWRLRDDARGQSAAWYDDLVSIAGNVVDRRAESLVVGEHAESVERPYGTVHRHAVLLDASSRVIAETGDELRAWLAEGAVERLRFRRRVLGTLASGFGVAIVVLLVYSFLNAGTKGYFAWPLRILSILALGLLFLGILYGKGWLVA